MIDLGTFGENVYLIVTPTTYAEEQEGYPIARFVNGAGQMFDEVELLCRDSEDGIGWSIAVDVDRCPDDALNWLAQFVGVTIPDGLTEDDRRLRIKSTDGWKRGTPAALIAAPIPYLTGNKTVVLKERDGSAYRFTVITYRDETPPEDWPVANIISNPSFETNTAGWVTE